MEVSSVLPGQLSGFPNVVPSMDKVSPVAVSPAKYTCPTPVNGGPCESPATASQYVSLVRLIESEEKEYALNEVEVTSLLALR